MFPNARAIATWRPSFGAVQNWRVASAFRRAVFAPVLPHAEERRDSSRRAAGGVQYTRRRSDLMRDLMARVFVGGLFAMMSWNLLGDFQRTGHVTGLLLLASESLVVVLTVCRRRAQVMDRSAMATVMTTLSLAGPPLVQSTGRSLAPDAITAIVSATGLLLVIAAKMTLGRSFGIAPANRGVVAGGPYNFVRHPIYTGYIITHAAFVMAHPSPWNITLLAITDMALVGRALIEERVLRGDAKYQAYSARVAWHLVPGVF